MLGYQDVRCSNGCECYKFFTFLLSKGGQDEEMRGGGVGEEADGAHAQQVCHHRLQDPHHRVIQLDNSGT